MTSRSVASCVFTLLVMFLGRDLSAQTPQIGQYVCVFCDYQFACGHVETAGETNSRVRWTTDCPCELGCGTRDTWVENFRFMTEAEALRRMEEYEANTVDVQDALGIAATLLVAAAAADSATTNNNSARPAPGRPEWIAPEGMVHIPAGSFQMGSPMSERGREDHEALHEVTLTRPFWISATEVTGFEWQQVMGAERPLSSCSACAATGVSWYDAVAFANRRSAAEGLPPCYSTEGAVIGGETVYDCAGYRLPTEAEWEYAARAGTSTATYGGDLVGDSNSCDEQPSLTRIGTYCGGADVYGLVGQLRPNEWGVYDMIGGVFEWVHDFCSPYPAGHLVDPVVDEAPYAGALRVTRSGTDSSTPSHARAAYRDCGRGPEFNWEDSGFRLARSAD